MGPSQIPRRILIAAGYLAAFLLPLAGFAGTPPDSAGAALPDYRKLRGIFAIQSAVYVGSLYALSKSWYKNPLTGFRVKDDFHEWLRTDKLGHLYTAYQISRYTSAIYRQTNISRKQAIIYGAVSGFIFQTPIELLDGFSPEYGFSPTDVAANLAGSLLFAGQLLLWDELRIQAKFSAHTTRYAPLRPGLLGRTLPERLLKDYNGQTYWFSASPRTFFPGSRWPAWLCVSAGYGIGNMIAAEPAKSRQLGYPPYRQYYLSLDIDLTRIQARKKWIRTLGFLLNAVKFPAPALEINRNGLRFHPIYF